MAAITLDANGDGSIPARTFNNLAAGRRALVFHLVSGTASWGWDNTGTNTGTVSVSTAADAGIAMAVNEKFSYSSDLCDCSRRILFKGSAAAVINYQENLQTA
jgi:hypothetical protein